jgi:hypothetical protein
MPITSKPINPAQLSVELGRIALRVTGPYPTARGRSRRPTRRTRRSGLALDNAHRGPGVDRPEPAAPPPPTDDERARTQLDQIRDKAKVVLAGNGTFTPAELQRILAANVLRASR